MRLLVFGGRRTSTGSSWAELDECEATSGRSVERIARWTAHCYQAGADGLRAAHRGRDFLAELEPAMGVIEDSLRQLVPNDHR
jgi:hypothetical protein